MEENQIPEILYGSVIELMKQRNEELYNRLEAIENGQKKFRKKPTNVTPKKKKRKK